MTDPITILKSRAEKAEAKVARYAKSLESAKKELSDIQTALRVMADIAGESSGDSGSAMAAPVTATSNRQQEIAELLGVGRANGRSPIDMFDRYVSEGTDEINIDTFRTTIWRMKNKSYTCDGEVFIIRSGDGEYWRQPASQAFDEEVSDLLG